MKQFLRRWWRWLKYKEWRHLKGEALQRAIEGFEKQAQENYAVSKEIQLRDGVDARGRKRKK